MAKATQMIHKQQADPEAIHEREVYELEQLLIEHQDTLKELLSVMEKLKDHEAFNMANGVLGQSEEILYRVVTEMDNSNTPYSLKNILLMFSLLGKLDMEALETVVLKINKGAKSISEMQQPTGYTGVIKSLKDPDFIEGLNVFMTLTKAFGEEQPDDSSTSDETMQRTAHDKQKSVIVSKKWMTLSFGISMLLLPLAIWFRKE